MTIPPERIDTRQIRQAATTAALPPMAHWQMPTRRAAVLFHIKVVLHRIVRGLRDVGAGLHRYAASDAAGLTLVLGESRTPLWADLSAGERGYQRGKVQNLRCAVRRLDRVVLPAGAVFSFWRQVGRASRRRGFVEGRMLQGGCLVPAVGGGLCQLSNALYDAALQAGCEIVERHAHSRRIAGAPSGRDATVAWNYVDLRFRCVRPLRIEAHLDRHDLLVRFYGPGQAPVPVCSKAPPPLDVPALASARSCASCGETTCFRHERRATGARDRVAFLVDENWPELQDHVGRTRTARDVLGLPLDGARCRLPRYRWETDGFARVGTAARAAAARMIAMRRLPMQGAARRERELQAAEQIAARLSRLLTADVTTVCVAQSLLPFLWRAGHLDGRDLQVMMTRLPMIELHARLDSAAAFHPESQTLRDFRAPAWLVEAEAEALDYASAIVTPHAAIAGLFADKVVRLDWQMPAPAAAASLSGSRRIAFPGPTVARKGAYDLRAAARALGLQVVVFGRELEGSGFWHGVECRQAEGNWLDGIDAVVQPAIVEDNPRRLLAALAAGVPVIATAGCGIAEHALLTIVPENDTAALIAALQGRLDESARRDYLAPGAVK